MEAGIFFFVLLAILFGLQLLNDNQEAQVNDLIDHESLPRRFGQISQERMTRAEGYRAVQDLKDLKRYLHYLKSKYGIPIPQMRIDEYLYRKYQHNVPPWIYDEIDKFFSKSRGPILALYLVSSLISQCRVSPVSCWMAGLNFLC